MNNISGQVTDSEASELLRRLATGVDTEILDGFIEDLLTLAVKLTKIKCGLADVSSLRLESENVILHEMTLPRAKTKLRMLCARLAVRCAAWSGRQVSPYGDAVDFEVPGHGRAFKVRFENTAEFQRFAIEAQAAT
jgi:hypothetical protein